MERRIRILCVDDHPIVREGISLIVQLEPDMEVIGQAATATEAFEAFRYLAPDITLMDLSLGKTSGVAAIRAIRRYSPDARVIVLTIHSGDEDVRGAFAAGAATYLLKETLSRDLVATIRAVYAGSHTLSPAVSASLEMATALPRLTRRELEVLRLVAQGRRNKEVAAVLSISEDTVESHLKNLFAKLQVSDRTAAVSIAIRRGFIRIP